MRKIPDAEIAAQTARFDQELAHLNEVLPIHLDKTVAAKVIEALRDDRALTHSITFSLTDCVPHQYWPPFLAGAAAALLSTPRRITPIWAGMCSVADYRAREARVRRTKSDDQ